MKCNTGMATALMPKMIGEAAAPGAWRESFYRKGPLQQKWGRGVENSMQPPFSPSSISSQALCDGRQRAGELVFQVSLLGQRADERSVDGDVGQGDGRTSLLSIMSNPRGKTASPPRVRWSSPCWSALNFAESP